MNFILATEGTTPANGSPMTMILMMGGMFVLMYFMMIRPQKKRQKEEEAMRNAVDVGDEITTIGGIVGRVVLLKKTVSSLKQALTEQRCISKSGLFR